jgi:hypothetical protein
VGLPLAEAEGALRARGLPYGVYRHLPPGSDRASGPFRNQIMLHIDEDDDVTDVSLG